MASVPAQETRCSDGAAGVRFAMPRISLPGSFVVSAAILTALLLVTPGQAAAVDVVTQCLEFCHSSIGPVDVETVYMGAGDSAGHAMGWNPRVVESTATAEFPQGSRMPCNECHTVHGANNDSIYLFSTSRSGLDTITEERDLCTGCHREYDAFTTPPVVLGLALKRLGPGVAAHGLASSTSCSTCHGSTGHAPESHGGTTDCGDPACHGGTGSHAIHLDDSDERGPGELACTDCHETDGFPYFVTGTDSDTSGHIDLSEADVCDECHSPGGSYDGVDSVGQSVGAKDNWDTKVYQTASTLQSGKEKWCVGCHDGNESLWNEEPSLIEGVYAPPVAGDEDEGYIYGTGYGFYKTGHGVPTSEIIPSNGFDDGPGLECDDCHDYTQTHIDGDRRSFTATDTPDDYRSDYRLDLVDGENPMLIPRPWSSGNSADSYRLCTDSGCHDPYPFITRRKRPLRLRP